MLFTIVCIYLGVWGCAYAAARRFGGRRAFWALYALAVLVVPATFSGVFHIIYARVDPANAGSLSATVFLMGLALGVVSYPVSHMRLRRGG